MAEGFWAAEAEGDSAYVHWHGATPELFMEHIAMWEGRGDGTPETTWLEPVTEGQYNGPRTSIR